jgi:polyvinyl alcohol dehydrogenase (cytochrome)
MSRRVGATLLLTIALGCSTIVAVATGSAAGAERDSEGHPVSRWDWPTYGHDAQHTFHGRTTLNQARARTLKPAWSFPTGDAVTATPTVVAGTVYAGSWDGWFYAVALRTGKLRWKFQLDPQPAVKPQPGVEPRGFASSGGLVTSSAWFQPGHDDRPDVVIFGGGYTLYALDARTGALVWKRAYTGRPELPPDPVRDDTRIFSSPVVAGDRVIFGISVEGARERRGYVAAASLRTGEPVWRFETDVDTHGRILNDGCGSVWSSGTVLPKPGLVVFDVADCHFSNPEPYSESVFALNVRDGTPAWVFRPQRPDVKCDTDFGATANAGITARGVATFLGVGGKDGTYYSLEPRTGELRWSTNVVFGGLSGGFIATAAYDGRRVFASTAIGDFGHFEGPGMRGCKPDDPRDVPFQEPTVHAFDARTGAITFQADGAPSFAPTTVAGSVTFNGLALRNVVQVRERATGALVTELPIPAPCWSGIATAGDAIVFGTGASHVGKPDGIVAFTPNGEPPDVPPDGSRPDRES